MFSVQYEQIWGKFLEHEEVGINGEVVFLVVAFQYISNIA